MSDRIKEWAEYFADNCRLPAGAICDLFDEIERLTADNKKLLARPLFRENRELERRIAKLEAELEDCGHIRPEDLRV